MMSITARSAGGAIAYYLHLSEQGTGERDEYYSHEGEGVWHGMVAQNLGLEGVVDRADFATLCAGFAPDCGQALTQNSGEADRLAGWDLTFSSPKSVSVEWALSDDTRRAQIELAHDAAVRRTLDHIETSFAITRRGQEGREYERCAIAAALFRHGTSREQDPQLHTHAFVLNAAQREDGTWGSLHTREIYRAQKLAGALYRAELARGMRELGYAIEADGVSFSLAHIPDDLSEHFSTRRQQIETSLREHGTQGAKASEQAALATRSAKEVRDPAELRSEWTERAQELGYDRDRIAELRAAREHRDYVPTARDALERATEHRAIVRERNIQLAAAIEAQHAGRGADDALDLARRAERQTLRVEDGRYTTQELYDAERTIMRSARERADSTSHALQAETVAAAIKRVGERSGYALSAEQQAAVRHLTERPGTVAVLIGDAGTGKTTSMQAVREAYTGAGYRVIGVAAGGKAAAGLQEETGIQSSTIDSMLSRIERGSLELTERDVIVVDEAGMVGSRHMHRLVALSEQAGAKLILSGDHKQLQPVAAGATFRHLANEQMGVGHARLSEVYRQRDAEHVVAVQRISRGEAAEAMRYYLARDQVRVAQTHRQAVRHAAGRYMAARDEVGEREVAVLSNTNARAEALNEAIRNRLQERGDLSETREFSALREIDRDRKTGEVRTRTERMELAVGDRVLSAGTNDRGRDLLRGDLGTVTRVDESGVTVRLDRDGQERHIDPALNDIRHGYAITTHRAQGATVNRTIVYTGADTSREMAYVQASRARESTEWVTTRHSVQKTAEALGLDPDRATLHQVTQAMSRERQAESTLDYTADRDRRQHDHQHQQQPEIRQESRQMTDEHEQRQTDQPRATVRDGYDAWQRAREAYRHVEHIGARVAGGQMQIDDVPKTMQSAVEGWIQSSPEDRMQIRMSLVQRPGVLRHIERSIERLPEHLRLQPEREQQLSPEAQRGMSRLVRTLDIGQQRGQGQQRQDEREGGERGSGGMGAPGAPTPRPAPQPRPERERTETEQERYRGPELSR